MPGIDFPRMEEEVLARWDEHRVFDATLKKEAPQGTFVFYEGPPTANGRPGIHHIEARAYKDVIPRYKTMRGFRVERKAGWDTHGLPVELEVEKKLGISGKPQIETLKSTPEESIAHFNALCKESVWTYLEDWKRLTRRVGFWVDMEHPYVTYEPPYIESLWAVTKAIWDRGLVYEDYKIVPYCSRCGTALSSHEVAQGYKEVTDPSIFVRFPTSNGRAFLVWTTTPWTLPANVALAVGNDITYVEVELNGEQLILAKSRLVVLEGQSYTVVRELLGSTLVGTVYQPLYTLKTPDTPAHRVVAGDFVSTDDGTGIVHIAPAFGEDDLAVARANNLPVLMTVNAEGQFDFGATTDPFGRDLNGMFVKDGDVLITEELKTRGLLFGIEPYIHEYPFCWRCSTPLLYYAKNSWFFAVSKVKEDLIANAETISWTPDYIKEGRFGEWLKGVRDWAISRERYWGTPLPIWRCADCKKTTCIGSFAELRAQATPDTRPADDFDPHRPFIDQVLITCSCGSTMTRVPEVMDVWFDSGAMPFAQVHYPFEGHEAIDAGRAYPAHYIAEAIDQTRGWFYVLLATATLLGKPAPYSHVICLGHLLDAKGLKMSKSKGNVVNPFEMMDKYGADACRMYMFTVNQPGDPKRFDEADIDLIVKKVMNLVWNVTTFYETYKVENVAAEPATSHVLDRWLLARLAELVNGTTSHLDAYNVTDAGRMIIAFIDDLSTWYVRRSRNRFKGEDRAAAAATLRHALATLSRVMAPFTPFLADWLYGRVDGTLKSVHLADWPTLPAPDQALLNEMARVRRIVSFGLEARAATRLPIRQPLAKAIVHAPAICDDCLALIAEELNVHAVEVVPPENNDTIEVTLDTELTPELRREGAVRELTRHIQNLRKTAGLTIQDTITIYLLSADDVLLDLVLAQADVIQKATRAVDIRREKADVDQDMQIHLGESEFWVGIKKVI